LLFLHGSGEAGDDIERVKVHGPPKIAERDPDFPFIVISPQLDLGGYMGWPPPVLHALLEQLKRELRIDPDRVSVTGLSLGGASAWAFAAAYPQDLAAAVPVCGYGNPRQICQAGKLPIWAFHGAKDDVVPPAASQALVSALQACGGNVQLTIYPDIGHNAWDPAYDDPALYRWLLAQRRSAR
jgi:predicted peptidase